MKYDDHNNHSLSQGHFWLKWCSSMIDELLSAAASQVVSPDLAPHCTPFWCRGN